MHNRPERFLQVTRALLRSTANISRVWVVCTGSPFSSNFTELIHRIRPEACVSGRGSVLGCRVGKAMKHVAGNIVKLEPQADSFVAPDIGLASPMHIPEATIAMPRPSHLPRYFASPRSSLTSLSTCVSAALSLHPHLYLILHLRQCLFDKTLCIYSVILMDWSVFFSRCSSAPRPSFCRPSGAA